MRDSKHTFLFGLSLILLHGVDYLVFCHQMRFESVKDGFSITGLEPYLKETMTSPIKCYMLCQRSPDKCCYVELTKFGDSLTCALFDFTGDLNMHLTPSSGSSISAPKGNPQMDCLDWRRLGYTKDGVYYINFNGYRQKVFCDMTTEGGGWIVMQKRFDGSVDFNRDWESYKKGFGDVYGEHWLGNEFVHRYTDRFLKVGQEVEMIAEATGFDGLKASVKYSPFFLAPEAAKYNFGGFNCQGRSVCVSWGETSAKSFSTKDQDNDLSGMNCAEYYRAGWWFNACASVNFNGPYSQTSVLQVQGQGITWDTFYDQYTALKTTEMKIRRKSS
ncbi:microfibril-associated glycoprotein 4-like [Clytia hemisphaerica]|uniref:Fibrinogen C-terminal domain-containing protein n=1 Tax=Clytia hemisphaerica TaxID=252671 RepID=A0A7M5VB88_9CNID